MGVYSHHAIVVTVGDDEALLRDVRLKADGLGLRVSSIVPSGMNGFHTFLVAPDGSKERWAVSDTGDAARNVLVDWMKLHPRRDALQWVEISYGEFGAQNGRGYSIPGASVTRCAWGNGACSTLERACRIADRLAASHPDQDLAADYQTARLLAKG